MKETENHSEKSYRFEDVTLQCFGDDQFYHATLIPNDPMDDRSYDGETVTVYILGVPVNTGTFYSESSYIHRGQRKIEGRIGNLKAIRAGEVME